MKPAKRLRQGALILALLAITGCGRPLAASSLLLGGDVMLYRAGGPIFEQGSNAFSPWGDLLTAKRMEPVDVFAVNLESPFGLAGVSDRAELTEMNLCADDSAAGLLQQAGVDLATNANNHAADCLSTDSGHTSTILQQAGIQSQGENSAVLFLKAGDQNIAVVSVNDYEGKYDLETLTDELTAARSKSDLVLVSVHWGGEYQAGPTPHQMDLAQKLVDAGADVIWGHHPHVLQRMEWLRSSADWHAGLVMYSMGNLLSDQWMLPDALRTALVRIEFRNHRITELMVIPMEMDAETKMLILVEDADGVDWVKQRMGLDGLSTMRVKTGIFELEKTN